MSKRDDNDFHIRPGAPKNRQRKFISQVLKQVSQAGGKSVRKSGTRPGARLGRGHVAARFVSGKAGPEARRVAIKARLVNLRQAGPRSTATHLRYIEREEVGRDGETGQAYGPVVDNADLVAFEERGHGDRHQFRFIVSPEDAEQLDDLRRYTRALVGRMEADLGTRLDWVAVNHWNTDNPHTHIVLRGKDGFGNDLIISRDYIAQGMRERASSLAGEWLGPRTDLEIQQALRREIDQERWTGLDRTLRREARSGLIHINRDFNDAQRKRLRAPLLGRLQRLQRMGLADEAKPGVWTIHADAERILRSLGERGDIVRTMQRVMGGMSREYAVFEPGENAPSIIGRVTGKGLADELQDRGYLVVDGIDGKAHYIALSTKSDLAQYPLGSVVEVHGTTGSRAADKNIAALAVNGVYRTDHHLAVLKAQATRDRDPHVLVAAHVRRLEALRRADIVERVAEGVWRVPTNLPERGRQFDSGRLGGVSVELRSHLPIERQVRVIGSTWLDQQLVSGGAGVTDSGFGGEVHGALRQRSDFLVEQGLAQRRGQRVVLARDLLATLRQREVEAAAKAFAAETGLAYRPVIDGERVTGTYRRSVQLASGRFAMLDDGMGFSLVPWKPVIEHRLGQNLSALVKGGRVSWDLGRQRGLYS
jgi:type IV secretory pathway VirD2 relaxase